MQQVWGYGGALGRLLLSLVAALTVEFLADFGQVRFPRLFQQTALLRRQRAGKALAGSLHPVSPLAFPPHASERRQSLLTDHSP